MTPLNILVAMSPEMRSQFFRPQDWAMLEALGTVGVLETPQPVGRDNLLNLVGEPRTHAGATASPRPTPSAPADGSAHTIDLIV